jgi:hypothetical protein
MIPYVRFNIITEHRWKCEHMMAALISGASWNWKYIMCGQLVVHVWDFLLWDFCHTQTKPPPPAPTKPLLIPDVANWLNFCCTTLGGGGQKKWYIPDIFLNVYTLTFIIIYKKGAFLVAWFFSSSADFVHTERAETFCPEFAVLLPGSRADWCQKAEFRAVGPKSGPVKYLAV